MKRKLLLPILGISLLFAACKKDARTNETPGQENTKPKKGLVVDPYKTGDGNGKIELSNPNWATLNRLDASQQIVFITGVSYYDINLIGQYQFYQSLDRPVTSTYHVQLFEYFDQANQKWRINKMYKPSGQAYFHIWNYQNGKHLGFNTNGEAQLYDSPVDLYLTETLPGSWSPTPAIPFPYVQISTSPDGSTGFMDENGATGSHPNGRPFKLKPASTSTGQRYALIFAAP